MYLISKTKSVLLKTRNAEALALWLRLRLLLTTERLNVVLPADGHGDVSRIWVEPLLLWLLLLIILWL